jgi:hypothetical protein
LGIFSSKRSGREGSLAGEKLQGVLESAFGCSVFATDRANAKVASGGRSRGQRRSNSIINLIRQPRAKQLFLSGARFSRSQREKKKPPQDRRTRRGDILALEEPHAERVSRDETDSAGKTGGAVRPRSRARLKDRGISGVTTIQAAGQGNSGVTRNQSTVGTHGD